MANTLFSFCFSALVSSYPYRRDIHSHSGEVAPAAEPYKRDVSGELRQLRHDARSNEVQQFRKLRQDAAARQGIVKPAIFCISQIGEPPPSVFIATPASMRSWR